MPNLLDKRLIFVTGKGGVGKSTVATALGLAAARRGARTIVAELASQDRVARNLGGASARGATNGSRAAGTTLFRELELTPGLFTISIDPQHAMDEYLRVKTGALGQAIGSTRLFQAFAMATPGMRELLTIGKVWELAQFERQTEDAAPYDTVIVDAPATGHGLGFLRAPRTFAEIARVGPIARQAGKIAATIEDPDFTALVAITTPEEMPVTETLALRDAVLADGLSLSAVVCNALYPPRFDDGQADMLRQALADTPSTALRGALQAAISEHARAAAQAEQLDRLATDLPSVPLELPYLFCETIALPELEHLADELVERLEQ